MKVYNAAPLRNVRKRLNFLAASSAILPSFLAQAAVSVDTQWTPTVQGPVHSLLVQPDGQVVLGGEFWQVNGKNRSNLARLTTQAILDENFAEEQPNGGVFSLAQQNGNIVAGGRFGAVGSVDHGGVARYLASGQADHSFAVNTSGTVRGILMDGQNITICGDFHRVGVATQPYLAQLSAGGGLAPAFLPELQPNFAMEAGINCMASDGAGKTIVGGIFNADGQYATLARLNADGSIDSTYKPAGAALYILAVKPAGDGKLLVAGMKSAQGDGFVRRLNVDGSIDTSFTEVNADRPVNDLVVTSSGKIVVGGDFENIGGVQKSKLAQLNIDGSINADFTADVTGTQATVKALALGIDDVIVAAGFFSSINGSPVSNVARLYDDGKMTPQGTNINRGKFVATLQGEAGKTYLVEASADLKNWTAYTTVTATHQGIEVVDGSTLQTALRFFRARLVE